jgi:hypothetical protein
LPGFRYRSRSQKTLLRRAWIGTKIGVVVPPVAGRTLTPKVEIAFDSTVNGVFLIDYSGLDGPDGLADDLLFAGTYNDVTADVDESVTIVLGSDDLAGVVQASTCDFALVRPTDIGYWNPRNPTSAPNSVSPGFKEMRPVRVTGNDGAADHGLFFGFIRNAHFDAASGICQLHCEDLLLWLARLYPVIASTGATTTGAAIGLILDAANWNDPTLRDLAVGDSIADFSADGTKTGLQLIADLLAAERGTVYIDPEDGVVVYRNRDYPQTSATVATLTNQLVDLGADLDVDRINTRVTVTRTGGVAQTTIDNDAEADYGRGDQTSIDTPYLPSDALALLLAGDILTDKKRSIAPVRAQMQNDDAATLQLQLSLRPLQALAISEDLAGTSGTYTVQQIKQRLDTQGFYLETEMLATLRDPELTPFRIDLSELDGNDVLRY